MKNWKRLQSESLFQRTAASKKITIWVPICHQMGAILGQLQASWALVALVWHTKRGIEKCSLPKRHEPKLLGKRTDSSTSPRGGQKEGKKDRKYIPHAWLTPEGSADFEG